MLERPCDLDNRDSSIVCENNRETVGLKKPLIKTRDGDKKLTLKKMEDQRYEEGAKGLLDKSHWPRTRKRSDVVVKDIGVAQLLLVGPEGRVTVRYVRWLDCCVTSDCLGASREPAHCSGDSRSIPPREEQMGGPPGHAHAPLCLLQHCHQELPPCCGGCYPGSE
jgi:hypothetical protein